jgi:alkylated DNA repair dioxygenase AlkB
MGLAPQPRTAMRVPLLLEPGSLYVMRDVARYQWKHGIMACKSTSMVRNGSGEARGSHSPLELSSWRLPHPHRKDSLS